jgi:hypothetical protein
MRTIFGLSLLCVACLVMAQEPMQKGKEKQEFTPE